MKRRKLQRTYWLTMLILLFPFIFPVFEVANRATPIVLGLPFNFFWICLWTFITFIVVLIFYWLDPENREEDK